MRRVTLSGLVVALVIGVGLSAHAMVIAQSELPSAVQETVLNESKGVALKSIEMHDLDGRSVYEVVWQVSGINIGILTDQDGNVLARRRRPAND